MRKWKWLYGNYGQSSFEYRNYHIRVTDSAIKRGESVLVRSRTFPPREQRGGGEGREDGKSRDRRSVSGKGYGERMMERVAWGSIIGLHYNSLTGAWTDERIWSQKPQYLESFRYNPSFSSACTRHAARLREQMERNTVYAKSFEFRNMAVGNNGEGEKERERQNFQDTWND